GIDVETANNTVDSDVISGNGQSGVYLNGGNATGNTVQLSNIGLSADGLTDLGNDQQGVYISIAPDNLIGANYISGNTGDGVLISGTGATGNHVQNNVIGLDVTGATAMGNLGNGVTIADGPVGGTHGNVVQTNTISSNGKDGVQIHDSAGNL